MRLEKFLGSKVKSDIIKYLYFCRQGISIRALETELGWSFPAVKKQIEMLEFCGVIDIDKDNSGWSIRLNDNMKNLIGDLLFYYIKSDIIKLFDEVDFIKEYFFGNVFGNNIGVDLVVIYDDDFKNNLNDIKGGLEKVTQRYYIKTIQITFMGYDEFMKRYRLADKFVLNLMNAKNGKY